MKHARLLAAAALLAALAAPAFAQVANGGFTSALSGWTAVGDASVRDSAGYVTNAALAFDDDDLGAGFHNFSGAEPVSAADLETALGLAADALSPDAGGGVFAYEGSALFQTVTVQAGDVLSFDWTFLSNAASGPDYAFVVIDGTVFDLGSGATLSAGSTHGFGFTSGAQTFVSSPFAVGGAITVGFGVVDVNDFSSSSALSFDNVSVSAIPEPSSAAALAGAGMLALAAARRRRRS